MQNHSGGVSVVLGLIPLQGSWSLPVHLRGDNLVRCSLNVSLARAATSIIFVTTNKSFDATKVCLSGQNFCQDKHIFVMTSLLLSRQTRLSVETNVFVMTKLL